MTKTPPLSIALFRIAAVLGAVGQFLYKSGADVATGPLYNEVPDRISDPILLIAAGYAIASSPTAGCAAAAAALLVAYVRAIAASVGTGQLYLGPMAKPQRMAVLTAIAIAGVVLPPNWLVWNVLDRHVGVVEIALWVIVPSGVVTVVRRLGAAERLMSAQSGVVRTQSGDA